VSQCKGRTIHGRRCNRRDALVTRGFCPIHHPRFYLTDNAQIARAKALFEWWWVRSNDGQYNPRWEKCDPTIQAFWMDGAWMVSQSV
jgi:hypothetical protein